MEHATPPPAREAATRTAPLAILARFLRFGLLAWGGPVAQIAMLRRELVDEQHWIDGGRFNRLLAIYQVLPGPEAHELAVHLGLLRGGRLGGLLAGIGFMAPGFALMFLLSWLYFQVDLSQAAIGAALLGAQVAVVALVARAVGRIGGHVLVDTGTWAIAIAAAAATLAGVPFWITLPVAGIAYVVALRTRPAVIAALVLVAAFGVLAWVAASTDLALVTAGPPVAAPLGPTAEPSALAVFVSGLKAGLLTFGGAYTAIPFLRGDAVGSGWLTDAQFLDGLALSGVLPAPLIIFSTFVGFVSAGPVGAVAMTLGVFLPAFSFSLVFGDRLEAVIENPSLHRLLEGIAAGVVGLIAVTALELAIALTVRLPSLPVGIAIFAGSTTVLVAWRSRAAIPLVIAGAAAAGWITLGGLVPLS